MHHCTPPERKLSTCYFSRIHRPRRHSIFYISVDLKPRTCSDKKLNTYKMFLSNKTYIIAQNTSPCSNKKIRHKRRIPEFRQNNICCTVSQTGAYNVVYVWNFSFQLLVCKDLLPLYVTVTSVVTKWTTRCKTYRINVNLISSVQEHYNLLITCHCVIDWMM